MRRVEAEVQKSRSRGESSTEPPGRRRASAVESQVQQALARALGTDVRLRRTRSGKGRVEIVFYDDEDLERLFERLVGREMSEELA